MDRTDRINFRSEIYEDTISENRNGLEILRIWQDSGIIKVPEQIEGIPVIRIAPYTFSLHKDEEEKNASVYQAETDEEDDRFAQPEELCCGGIVREIHLPSTVQSIGNYAFYGCMNLKLFHGTDAIVRMGSGVFTGCRLEKVEIDFMDGNKSCLKEILTEIPVSDHCNTALSGNGDEDPVSGILRRCGGKYAGADRGDALLWFRWRVQGVLLPAGTGLWKIRPAVCTF